MTKQDFLNYIIDFSINVNWEDCHGKDQIRALFTSWCLIFRIDADTKECDDALSIIYWRAAMEELVEYEEYERFMIEFIMQEEEKQVQKVICINERNAISRQPQIIAGKEYYLDLSSVNGDFEGDWYGEIYSDKNKSEYIGHLKLNHFRSST